MKLDDLDKYVGHYVSFDYAILPPKNKNTDINTHIEGTLIRNTGSISHYAIKEYGGIALRDDMVGLIINFEDKEELELL